MRIKKTGSNARSPVFRSVIQVQTCVYIFTYQKRAPVGSAGNGCSSSCSASTCVRYCECGVLVKNKYIYINPSDVVTKRNAWTMHFVPRVALKYVYGREGVEKNYVFYFLSPRPVVDLVVHLKSFSFHNINATYYIYIYMCVCIHVRVYIYIFIFFWTSKSPLQLLSRAKRHVTFTSTALVLKYYLTTLIPGLVSPPPYNALLLL